MPTIEEIIFKLFSVFIALIVVFLTPYGRNGIASAIILFGGLSASYYAWKIAPDEEVS